MYYIPHLLSRRNRGQLARCWLAATLSERDFKKNCKLSELHMLNIQSSCEEIQSAIIHKHQSDMRFSLYLSSQLMYGVSKIFEYKVKMLEEFVKKFENEMMIVNTKKSSKKGERKRVNNIIDLDNIPDPPPFPEEFLIEAVQIDHHLISDYYSHKEVFLNPVKVLDDQEECEFDRLTSEDAYALMRGHLFAELSVDKAVDMNRVTHDEVSIQMPLAELTSRNFLDESVLKTPTKRKARTIDTDTPSKRHRKNLSASLENKENIEPPEIPMTELPDHLGTLPALQTTDDHIFHDFRQSQSLINNNVERSEILVGQVIQTAKNDVVQEPDANTHRHHLVNSSDMSLQPIVPSEISLRRQKKYKKFVDTQINLSNDVMRMQIQNNFIMTRPINMLRINIDRIRLDSQLLFKNPSTSSRLKSNFMWANELKKIFEIHIHRRFHEDYCESLFPESMRFRDISEKTAELSKDIMNTQHVIPLELSDKNETPLNVSELPHVGVLHEPTDIVETGIVGQTMVQSELATTHLTDEMNVTPTADTAPVKNSIRFSSSNDILVPNFEKELVPVRHSGSLEENIIDTNNIRFSSKSKSQSKSPNVSAQWTRENLANELERRWIEKKVPMRFDFLFPPATTRKIDVSCILLDLLHLAKDHCIILKQAAPFKPIWIYLNFLE